MENNSKIMRALFLLITLSAGSLSVFADGVLQDGTSGKWGMSIRGNFDIKMISAPVIHPVWVKSSAGQPYVVEDIITEKEMLQAGNALSRNNNLGGNSANPNDVATNSGGGWVHARDYDINQEPEVLRPAGSRVGTAMVYADCDEDMNTFQSSAAFLSFGAYDGCANIEKAYLYWTGVCGNGTNATQYAPYNGMATMRSHAGGATGTVAGGVNKEVWFKGPGMTNYAVISSATGYDIRQILPTAGGDRYAYKADVTNLVKGQGEGLYWAANVRSSSTLGTSGGASAGWSLVIIYKYPNCPQRTIKIWDTNTGQTTSNPPYDEGHNITFTFDAGNPALGILPEVPASGNSVSYFGIIALDGEDDAGSVAQAASTPTTAETEAIARQGAFQFNGGMGTKIIQPFIVDGFGVQHQPTSWACKNNGTACTETHWGICSGQITTWDDEKGTNGNQITRLPDNRVTAGYDAHHLRLPPNSIAPATTTATLRLPEDITSGSLSAFMAYVAIETLQPVLKLSMSVDNEVAPGGVLTYRLRVENTGTLKSLSGAYITNLLPNAVDLVPGSITYALPDTYPAGQPPVITAPGPGIDNETITLYLPEIAAGDGINATDWVEITYQVKVHDLNSRPDIWTYGCSREIENIATLTYTTGDGGGDVTTGSNAASAGCGATGRPVITNVKSDYLDEFYADTHIITVAEDSPIAEFADLAARIFATQKPDGSTTININTELRKILARQYALLGLKASELPLYSINDSDGFPVLPGDNFVIMSGETSQEFTADATLPGGCDETFRFILQLVKVPNVVEDPDNDNGDNAVTSCVGVADGVLNVVVSGGTPGYSITVTNTVGGAVIFTGFSPVGQNDFTFVVKGVAVGKYDILVGDKNGFAPVKQVVVADPQAIVPTVKTECTVNGVLLKASATARPGATLQYAWKSAADGYSATLNGNLSAPDYETTTPGSYRVIICDAACAVSADVILPAVSVNPAQQTVSVLSPTPQATFNAILTGADATASYQYNWQLATGTVPGTLAGANTASLTVSNITNKAMNGNQYKVTVTDSRYAQTGCVGIAEGTLYAVEAPVVVSTPYTASCPDATDGSMVYSISNGESGQTYVITLKDENGAVVETINYLASAVYTGVKTGLAGGDYTWYVDDPALLNPITYDVTVATIPRPVTKLTSESVCFGAELTAEASGNYSTYEWTIDGVIDASQTESVYVYAYNINTVAPGTDVNIQVVALSDLGCRSEAQDTLVTLKMVPDPLVQKAPAPYTSCVIKGEYLDWNTLVENPDEYNLMWYELPVGGGAGVANPDLINKGYAGEYTRYVSAVGDGCPSLRAPITAIIYPNPEIITVDKVDLRTVRVIVANGLPPYTYDYEGQRNDFDSKFEINSTLTFPFALGVHKFLVIDTNNCQAEGFFHINKTVLEPASYFSPNDDGDNELWTINHLEAYLDSHITIEIFDRMGKKLAYYDAKNFNGWDGKYKGEVLPSTDYWYSIYIQETDERIVGHFSLKR